MQAEDPKLVELRHCIWSQCPSETKRLKNQSNNTTLYTLHALPLTVIKALIESVKKLVVQIGFGLEGKKRNGVGGQQ